MIKNRMPAAVLAFASCVVLAGSANARAYANLSRSDRCEATKLKHTGKYVACRLKAEATAIKNNEPPNYSKCEVRLYTILARAERQAGWHCPTLFDYYLIREKARALNRDLVTFLSGAAPPRFEDTGLTVIDHWTGLEWEKKTGVRGSDSPCPGGTDCGDPHHVNNRYSWSSTGTAFDGGAKTLFLDSLNDVAGGAANCFAGHCDWRLPKGGAVPGSEEYDVAEFELLWTCYIANLSCDDGTIDPVFGPTEPAGYWSSESYPDDPSAAWVVVFLRPYSRWGKKVDTERVRAVRDFR